MMVTDKAEVEGAMRDAIDADGPVLLDVRVTKEENCYPMIPAGAAARREVVTPTRTLFGGHAAIGGPLMEAGTPDLVRLEDLEVGSQLTGRKHILSLLVENRPGVLARIAGLFSRRGFNIDTLTVGPTDDPNISRITLTLDGAVHPIDQVTKQLHKLVNVIKIRDMEPGRRSPGRWRCSRSPPRSSRRGEIMQFAEIFRAKIVEVSRRTLTSRSPVPRRRSTPSSG